MKKNRMNHLRRSMKVLQMRSGKMSPFSFSLLFSKFIIIHYSHRNPMQRVYELMVIIEEISISLLIL